MGDMSGPSSGCSLTMDDQESNFQLSILISVAYFLLYLIITFIVSIYAHLQRNNSQFVVLPLDQHYCKESTTHHSQRYREFVKFHVFILLHFLIQAINLGIIVQLYFLSSARQNCQHLIIPASIASSINVFGLFLSSLLIFCLYRVISSFKIYSMTHSVWHSIAQFFCDDCIIRSFYVELIKHHSVPQTHYVRLSYCFQWFLCMQSYYNAAPNAFIQLVAILLYVAAHHVRTDMPEHDDDEFAYYNYNYVPFVISCVVCFLHVILVTFEVDAVVFNPGKFWCARLLFRVLDITLRLVSIALFWLTVGGYFVVIVLGAELGYIFIACIRLQLSHRGLLNGKDRHYSNATAMSPSPGDSGGLQKGCSHRGKVRISNEHGNVEYIYRAQSINGRVTLDQFRVSAHAVPGGSLGVSGKDVGVMAMETAAPAAAAVVAESTVTEYIPSAREHEHESRCSLVSHMLLHVLDYYAIGLVHIIISFRLEDRSSLFAVWFWRYRVLFNVLLMTVVTVFGYARIWCPVMCFHVEPYAGTQSAVQLNADHFYIGFALFVYCWCATLLLPCLFVYLANGKIRTDKYAPKNLKDIMIVGDVVGIFELDIFGVFDSKKNAEIIISKRNVYALTACNLNWTELDAEVLMSYLHILRFANVNFDEICDPFDTGNNLVYQLVQNQNDCYRWLDLQEITQIMDAENTELLAVCCKNGNFRILKEMVKLFGRPYLSHHAVIALHYAFHCVGSAMQQKQADRLIVYVLKNTDLSMKEFVEMYTERQERSALEKLIRSRAKSIKEIQRETERKNDTKNTTANDEKRPSLTGTYLSLLGNFSKTEQNELLSSPLSNNSIVSIEMEEESVGLL